MNGETIKPPIPPAVMEEIEVIEHFKEFCAAAQKLYPDEILEIYRRIASGEEPHGEFLTSFAKAVVHADGDNFQLMKPAACVLILKYSLNAKAFPA